MNTLDNVTQTIKSSFVQHPYHPVDLVLDAWEEPHYGVFSILSVFFGALSVYIPILLYLSRKSRHLSTLEKVLFVWFAISGAIHIFIELPFVVNPNFYKVKNPSWADDLWKEYGKADSRYCLRDQMVITVEAFAAFVEGPFCFLTAYFMYKDNPWWIPAAITTSFPQLYGCIQYFAIQFIDNFKFTRPEFLYFWFYMVIMNQFWFTIPIIAIGHCFNRIGKSLKATHDGGKKNL